MDLTVQPHNLEIRNFGNQWVQHRRGQFGGGLSERGHQSGACLGGTFENCSKGIPKSFQSQSIKKSKELLHNECMSESDTRSVRYRTAGKCPARALEFLRGECGCEVARGQQLSRRQPLACDGVSRNFALDFALVFVLPFLPNFVPFLPILFHSFFSILFFSILFHSFPFCPILSHCFPFFPILFSFLQFFLLSYFFFSHFFLSYFKLLHAISHYFSVFFSVFLVCDSPAAQFSSGVPSSGEISDTTPVTCTAHQCRR